MLYGAIWMRKLAGADFSEALMGTARFLRCYLTKGDVAQCRHAQNSPRRGGADRRRPHRRGTRQAMLRDAKLESAVLAKRA